MQAKRNEQLLIFKLLLHAEISFTIVLVKFGLTYFTADFSEQIYDEQATLLCNSVMLYRYWGYSTRRTLWSKRFTIKWCMDPNWTHCHFQTLLPLCIQNSFTMIAYFPVSR